MLAFLETVDPESNQQVLPVYDEKSHVLLFFKYYNPKTKVMAYCGHLYVSLTDVPSMLLSFLCNTLKLFKLLNLLMSPTQP